MKYHDISEARQNCERIVQYPHDKDLFLVLHIWDKDSYATHMWNAQDGGLYHGGYYRQEEGEFFHELEQRALNAFGRRVLRLYAGFLPQEEESV